MTGKAGRSRRPAIGPHVAALALLLTGAAAWADPLVFAAASTGRAMDAVIAAYGAGVTTSYAASGTLARQIEQGAPADMFLSANPKWMAHLVGAGLIPKADVTPILSNRLVLIAPAGTGPVAPDDLAARLDGERFVMADPVSAPVGRYGQSAMEEMGLWATVAPALAPTRNTVATVAAVASGEAALGLVYASDAMDVEGVEVVFDIPKAAQPEILYLIAPTGQGDDAEGAAAFLAFLQSPAAAAIFADHGFSVPDAE
ncbi:molybdate transport system substrate-binding protein [Rhodovulum iodosum]|uniref:Molybdate transport system substrate-binding protein n=1 Tax=Rhodovulum iodosum TaxID=68291 RepID=A0ABV3XY10_9RHOB|nr:molybdate ABC transporter substrate-binding protein [Rhodovulum robiginosum]RSK37741.1 molybdate ABC transporter substrate-binding protein [Rhodovulum robiginosum]